MTIYRSTMYVIGTGIIYRGLLTENFIFCGGLCLFLCYRVKQNNQDIVDSTMSVVTVIVAVSTSLEIGSTSTSAGVNLAGFIGVVAIADAIGISGLLVSTILFYSLSRKYHHGWHILTTCTETYFNCDGRTSFCGGYGSPTCFRPRFATVVNSVGYQ